MFSKSQNDDMEEKSHENLGGARRPTIRYTGAVLTASSVLGEVSTKLAVLVLTNCKSNWKPLANSTVVSEIFLDCPSAHALEDAKAVLLDPKGAQERFRKRVREGVGRH
jgi:hypothetical protein